MRKKILLAILIILPLLYLGGAWFFSNIIIKFPTRSVDEDRIRQKIENVAALGLPEPETVEIGAEWQSAVAAQGANTEALKIAGWYFAQPGGPQKCAAILHHGHTGTRWGGLRYSRLFWSRGCAILTLDARYHGESEGDCGSYGYHERYDLQRAIAWLQKRTGLPKNKIALMGESMGAAFVLMAAALEPELAFVAADSPYRGLVPVVRERGIEQYGEFVIDAMVPGAFLISNLRCDMQAEEVSPEAAAQNIQIPVYLSHSASDTGTLPYHSEKVFEAVPHNRKVLHINQWNAPHARDVKVNYEGYSRQFDAFLKEFAPQFTAASAP